MKIFLVLFTLISSTCAAQVYLANMYTIRLDENLVCELHMYKESNYYIGITEQTTHDFMYTYPLSCGTFIVEGDQIIFTDQYHNFKMKMLIKGNGLTVIECFQFLMNKQLNFLARNHETIEGICSEISETSWDAQESQFPDSKEFESYFFESGEYTDYQGFVLDLSFLGTFKLYYRKFELCNGTYERKGNKLVLTDATLNLQLEFLISKGLLTGKLLSSEDKIYFLGKK